MGFYILAYQNLWQGNFSFATVKMAPTSTHVHWWAVLRGITKRASSVAECCVCISKGKILRWL